MLAYRIHQALPVITGAVLLTFPSFVYRVFIIVMETRMFQPATLKSFLVSAINIAKKTFNIPKNTFKLAKNTSLFALAFTSLNALADNAAYNEVAAEEFAVEEIIIESSLTPLSWQQASSGLSIIDADAINNSSATFITDILTQAPNVNFSGGTSRGRFFQIRGTGQRSQFIDPINPSVSLSIDGVDFSGAANIASLFDIRRVEILRGPQGTAFGTNASAGLINILLAEATDINSTTLSGSLGSVSGNQGDWDSHQVGVVVNGKLADSVNGRLALQRLNNDGFTNNQFLKRDDTTKIDESLIRGKLNWRASELLDIKTTLLYSDVDNGYDAFNLDNLRDTITDEPGFDRQETNAISINASYSAVQDTALIVNIAHSDNEVDYGFDEDWTFTGFDPSGYTSFDRYTRDIKNTTVDIRYTNNQAASLDWTSGVYYRNQTVDLLRTYSFDSDFSSDYDTRNLAIYAELNIQASDKLSYSIGARVEDFDADYDDNLGEQSSPAETLWGAHISVNYTLSEQLSLFSRLSKGFKPSGVNSQNGGDIPEANDTYDTETLYNFEVGTNFSGINGALRGQLTAFYQERHDAQIKQSLALSQAGDGNCPCDFEDYIDNANQTNHYGLEFESHFQLTPTLLLSSSIGYLQAEFDDYSRISEGINEQPLIEQLDGREVANAPKYQFAISADLAITEQLSLWVQVEGRDSQFFSNRHEVKSDSYELVNAKLKYEQDNWQVALWAKNLSNEDYAVRGFGSFGNDPRNAYAVEPYFQFAMPRQVGISGSIHFD